MKHSRRYIKKQQKKELINKKKSFNVLLEKAAFANTQ